jgi:hypothetical protein
MVTCYRSICAYNDRSMTYLERWAGKDLAPFMALMTFLVVVNVVLLFFLGPQRSAIAIMSITTIVQVRGGRALFPKVQVADRSQ